MDAWACGMENLKKPRLKHFRELVNAVFFSCYNKLAGQVHIFCTWRSLQSAYFRGTDASWRVKGQGTSHHVILGQGTAWDLMTASFHEILDPLHHAKSF